MKLEIEKTYKEIDVNVRILEAQSTQDLRQLSEEFHNLVIEASPEEQELLSDQVEKIKKLKVYDILGMDQAEFSS